MTDISTMLQIIGAGCFGMLIGWYIYYINRHRTDGVTLGDLITLIGAIGGAAVLTLFPAGSEMFGAYGIGLAIGFFGYFLMLIYFVLKSKPDFTFAWFLDGRCTPPKHKSGPTPFVTTPIPNTPMK